MGKVASLIALGAILALCQLQLAAGAASGFVKAPGLGASCPAVCSTVDQNPAGLQQFGAQQPLESYACAANVSGQGLVPGYQLTSNTTCTVAVGSSVDMYNDFSCLCVDSTAELGIVAAAGSSCSFECNQTVNGLVGGPVSPTAAVASDTCIPSQDIGILNRFGHTGTLGEETEGCFAAIDGSPYTTASFSCLCLFEPPATLQQAPAVQAAVSSDALATGG